MTAPASPTSEDKTDSMPPGEPLRPGKSSLGNFFFGRERLNIGRTWPALFLMVAALLFWRQPNALLRPTLYAEDGGIFFRQQYEVGFRTALLTHYAGYLHFAPRTIAALCSWFPIEYIPYAYAAVSLFIAAGVLTFFFAAGFRQVVDSDGLRAGIVLVFTLMPNAEPLMKVAYINWYMLFFTALLTLYSLPQGKTARWLLLLPAVIAGWSNPVTAICLPVMLYRAGKASEWGERFWWSALLVLDVIFLFTMEKQPSPIGMLLHERSWSVALVHAIGYRVFCFFFFGDTFTFPKPFEGWTMVMGVSFVLAALCGGVVALATARTKKNGINRAVPLMLFYLIVALPVLFILRREWQPLFLMWNRYCWQVSDRYFFCSTLLLCAQGGVVFERALRDRIMKTKQRREIFLLVFLGWLILQIPGFRLEGWQTEKSWAYYAQEIRAAETRAKQTGDEETVHIESNPSEFDFDLSVSKAAAERSR